MKRTICIVLCAFAPLAAQEIRHRLFTQAVAPPPDMLVGTAAGGATGNIAFLAHESFAPGQTVKGAPYSAEAVTESVQTLADGNRITRKNSSSIARDSEGRTRRENKLNVVGPWGVEGEPPSMITIDDPVAKTHYMLNTADKTAHKIPVPDATMVRGAVMGRRVMGVQTAGRPAAAVRVESGPTWTAARPAEPVVGETFHIKIREPFKEGKKPEEQSLGSQVIEGVKAEGTRTVMRIEAGEVGNERPIEIISERWYSPELQTAVMTKHSDPRFGETTFRLTRIDRREPPPSLFQPPPDYKLVEAGQRIESIPAEPAPAR
jgi:hypothetical protein